MSKKLIWAVLSLGVITEGFANDNNMTFIVSPVNSYLVIDYQYKDQHVKDITIPVSGKIYFNAGDITQSSTEIAPDFHYLLINHAYPPVFKSEIEFFMQESITFKSSSIQNSKIDHKHQYTITGNLTGKNVRTAVSAYADSYTVGSTTYADGNKYEQIEFNFHTEIDTKVFGSTIFENKVRISAHITGIRTVGSYQELDEWLLKMSALIKNSVDYTAS